MCAAGGVGDAHVVAVELGNKLDIWSLAAAGTRAGKLHIGLEELAAFDRCLLRRGNLLLRYMFQRIVPRLVQLLPHRLERPHLQRLNRACLDTDAAAGAVHSRNREMIL